MTFFDDNFPKKTPFWRPSSGALPKTRHSKNLDPSGHQLPSLFYAISPVVTLPLHKFSNLLCHSTRDSCRRYGHLSALMTLDCAASKDEKKKCGTPKTGKRTAAATALVCAKTTFVGAKNMFWLFF